MTKEEFKQLNKLQCKQYIYIALISKMPLGYTQNEVNQLAKDMQIKSDYDKNNNELADLVASIEEKNPDDIKRTYEDKEFVAQNRFTLDDQREAINEIIGKPMTFEEFFD